MVEFADGDEVLKAIRSAYASGDQALEENNMANAALPKNLTLSSKLCGPVRDNTLSQR
jgi:hypothetical protein